MVQDIEAQIMGKVVPALTDTFRTAIEKELAAYDISPQTLSPSAVTVTYNVKGGMGGAEIDIVVESGKISGTQVVDVRDHIRMGYDVARHQREYTDKRVFRLSNGEYITSETLPDEILEEIVEKAMNNEPA
jgi:hypothetical protein